VQSLNDARLQALGRIHDASEARRAIEAARTSFDNINLDMMFALPGQKPDEAIADLNSLLEFEPQHVSLYHLSIEPNTVFAKYPPQLPDEDSAAELQEVLLATLAGQGFERYEISAFAKPSYRSRHNLNYWNYGDYLGIGPGAHSKLSFAHRIVRQARVKQPSSYLARAAQGNSFFEETEVSVEELPFEFFLNALRLVEGVPRGHFEQRTGVPFNRITATVSEAIRRGLMQPDSARLQASAHGLLFLNDLQSMFLE
jgi:putative oxygen-independent coproporphyrinogen III oxidase